MALRVKVPKEIRSYKEKIIAGMDLRQLICASLAGCYSGCLAWLLVGQLHWSMDVAGNFIVPLDMPILAFGWIRPKGLPLEKYLKYILHYKNSNGIRIYENRKEVSLNVHAKARNIREYEATKDHVKATVKA